MTDRGPADPAAEDREAAERSRLEREQRARAATRRSALADARRLEDEEVARAKAERAERWRREQEEIARAAADKAAEKKGARTEARRRGRAAATAEKTARRASRHAERERRRSPRGAEISARTTPPEAAPAPPPPAPARSHAAAPAASPATGGGRRSYSERYADLAPPAGDGREVVRPRTGLHRLVTLLLLAALTAGAFFGYAAWRAPTIATAGIAAVCAAVALLLWAARASTAPVQVVIDHGILEVVARSTHHRFDLSSSYTGVEVTGEPGRRGWQVRLTRGDTPPLVLHASGVRSRELDPALRRWRPDL